jgi:hypothetical protein
LLRDLDQLRRTLETDLTLAAAAVEEGSLELAVDVLDHDRAVLDTFSQRAGQHLRPRTRSRARRILTTSAGPIGLSAAAAALVAMAILGPGSGGGTPSTAEALTTRNTIALTALAQPYQALVELSADDAEDHQVRAAASRLDAGVRKAQPQFKADPVAATAVLSILQAEHQVLTARDNGGSMAQEIARNVELTRQVAASVPEGTVVPPAVLPTATPTPAPSTTVEPTTPPVTEEPTAPPVTEEPTTPATTEPSPTVTDDPAPTTGLVDLLNSISQQLGTAPTDPTATP